MRFDCLRDGVPVKCKGRRNGVKSQWEKFKGLDYKKWEMEVSSGIWPEVQGIRIQIYFG